MVSFSEPNGFFKIACFLGLSGTAFFQVVYPPANHLPRGSIPVEKKPVVKTGCLLMRSFG